MHRSPTTISFDDESQGKSLVSMGWSRFSRIDELKSGIERVRGKGGLCEDKSVVTVVMTFNGHT